MAVHTRVPQDVVNCMKNLQNNAHALLAVRFQFAQFLCSLDAEAYDPTGRRWSRDLQVVREKPACEKEF